MPALEATGDLGDPLPGSEHPCGELYAARAALAQATGSSRHRSLGGRDQPLGEVLLFERRTPGVPGQVQGVANFLPWYPHSAVIVGIEPFGPYRAEVVYRLGKFHAGQIRPRKVRSTKVRPRKVSPLQARAGEVGVAKIGTLQRCFAKVGPGQVCSVKVRTLQVCTLQVRPEEIASPQVEPRQVAPAQVYPL